MMVNDDKPLLRIGEDGVTVYGTPWDGKHRLSTNMSAPLEAICILTRSAENTIREITPKEALTMLIQQTYRPEESELFLDTLGLIERVMRSVRFYLLGCNMDPEAARVSSAAMIK